MVARWGPAEDAKLVKLWRTPRNGVDYTKLDIPSVKAVHQKYFPERNYNTFAPRYREKAREFAVSQTLDGHRKRSAKAKSGKKNDTAAGVNLEDISDDEEDPYEDNEEDDEELVADEEEPDEDLEDEDLEDDERATMPPKKKAPIKKKASADNVAAGATRTAVDEITDQFDALKLPGCKMYSMDYKLPYMIYIYPEGEDTMCKIEMFAPLLPQSCFKPDVVNNCSALEVKIQVPDVFLDPNRSLMVNANRPGFNANTAEAQAFKATCEAIDEDNGFADTLFGEPQIIKLPFKVEERLVGWECGAYENDFTELNDELEHQQFLNSITILTRKQRAKKRTEGGFRVFRSPPKTNRGGGSGDANMGEE